MTIQRTDSNPYAQRQTVALETMAQALASLAASLDKLIQFTLEEARKLDELERKIRA